MEAAASAAGAAGKPATATAAAKVPAAAKVATARARRLVGRGRRSWGGRFMACSGLEGCGR